MKVTFSIDCHRFVGVKESSQILLEIFKWVISDAVNSYYGKWVKISGAPRIRTKNKLIENALNFSAQVYHMHMPPHLHTLSQNPSSNTLEPKILQWPPFNIVFRFYSHININRFSRKTFRRPWTATFKLRLWWNINYVCFVMFVSLLYLLVGVLLSFRIQ